jgi:hypothetical protein
MQFGHAAWCGLVIQLEVRQFGVMKPGKTGETAGGGTCEEILDTHHNGGDGINGYDWRHSRDR